ncbi:hypothetical protein I79_013815 [Cricetulus griseus]|uniref:Uncharacterized protein n=1 Tax=Cricetulus griseus TaxID=10029 RepID=G3HSI2_CRIGR|nr:hypothetical protein I79_013815 [Cricetulus griseus]
MFFHHLHIWCLRTPEECIRSLGSGIQVVLNHLMWVLGTKLGYPIAEVLRQLSIIQIHHYNSEDEDAP